MAHNSSLSLHQAVENLQQQLQAYGAIEHLLLDRHRDEIPGLAVLLSTITAAVNDRCDAIKLAAEAVAPRN